MLKSFSNRISDILDVGAAEKSVEFLSSTPLHNADNILGAAEASACKSNAAGDESIPLGQSAYKDSDNPLHAIHRGRG
jgi:hypothetical protein